VEKKKKRVKKFGKRRFNRGRGIDADFVSKVQWRKTRERYIERGIGAEPRGEKKKNSLTKKYPKRRLESLHPEKPWKKNLKERSGEAEPTGRVQSVLPCRSQNW